MLWYCIVDCRRFYGYLITSKGNMHHAAEKHLPSFGVKEDARCGGDEALTTSH